MNAYSVATRRYLITSFALLLTVLSMMFLSAGCGTEKKECTAPDLSTIALLQTEQTINTGGTGLAYDTALDWTVKVTYADGSPMPQACLTISGTFADPNSYGAYQFQYYPSWITPNVAVDSGFSAQTDDYGQYTFSTVLSAGTGTWTDTMYVRSGSNVGSAVITLN